MHVACVDVVIFVEEVVEEDGAYENEDPDNEDEGEESEDAQ